MKQSSDIVVRFLTAMSHRLVEASEVASVQLPSGNVTQLHVPFLHETRVNGFAAGLKSGLNWSSGRILSCRHPCLVVRV